MPLNDPAAAHVLNSMHIVTGIRSMKYEMPILIYILEEGLCQIAGAPHSWSRKCSKSHLRFLPLVLSLCNWASPHALPPCLWQLRHEMPSALIPFQELLFVMPIAALSEQIPCAGEDHPLALSVIPIESTCRTP